METISWPEVVIYGLLIVGFFTFLIVALRTPSAPAPKKRESAIPLWTTTTWTSVPEPTRPSEKTGDNSD